MGNHPPFQNRMHAGQLLAHALAYRISHAPDTLVLALPRGGVPPGFVVARALGLDLDLLVVRKLGLPGHEEYAIGAVGAGVRVVPTDVLTMYGLSAAQLDQLCARELAEAARRERAFRGARPWPDLSGKNVLLIDDGLATGSTMRAAIAVVRQQHPARLTAAVPVAADASCAAVESEVDELVCLVRSSRFRAVSQWYRQFDQTSDDEVQDLLARAWHQHPQQPTGAAPIPSSTNLYGDIHEHHHRQ